MVSKSEYLKYVEEMVIKDKNNSNLKFLSKGYKRLRFTFLIMFIVGLFGGLILSTGHFGNFGFAIVVISICLLVISIVMMFKSSKVEKYYKSTYREKFIGYLLNDIDWSFKEKDGIDEEVFKCSQFSGCYDDYKGTDKLNINIPNDDGNKSNYYLTLCDLDVTKTDRDSDGDRHTVTVYSGIFGYAHFPFEFKCILCLNTYFRYKNVKLERVNLEDINFNKDYKIYSSNQIEARYILTPNMMEKLSSLKNKLGSVMLTLVDNKMYIGFPHRDLFELSTLEGGNIVSIFEKFYDEVDVLLKIVEEIKSNNKVFKI